MPKKTAKPPKPPSYPSAPRSKRWKSTEPSLHAKNPFKLPNRASRKLLDSLPSDGEAEDIIWNLEKRNHHALAMLGASYLDSALERLLMAHFVPLSPDDQRRMFDGSANGILGTLSNKIRLSYAVKLLEDDEYSDLIIINDIRNVFAHSLHDITFENTNIKDDCNNLSVLLNISERNLKVESVLNYSTVELYTETVFYLWAKLTLNKKIILKRKARDRDS
jgi:hypothetical protein